MIHLTVRQPLCLLPQEVFWREGGTVFCLVRCLYTDAYPCSHCWSHRLPLWMCHCGWKHTEVNSLYKQIQYLVQFFFLYCKVHIFLSNYFFFVFFTIQNVNTQMPFLFNTICWLNLKKLINHNTYAVDFHLLWKDIQILVCWTQISCRVVLILMVSTRLRLHSWNGPPVTIKTETLALFCHTWYHEIPFSVFNERVLKRRVDVAPFNIFRVLYLAVLKWTI